MARNKENRMDLNEGREHYRVAEALTRGLAVLEEVQAMVSLPVPGAIPAPGELPTKDAVRTYTLAMIVEIAEWVQTLDYKPWKNHDATSYITEEENVVAEEFADILAFLGVLVLYMHRFGITPAMIAQAYVQKSKVNIQRIDAQIGGAHG
jgi:dimeric dUTPase (all-alpha-NTP-PPase superfamily)